MKKGRHLPVDRVNYRPHINSPNLFLPSQLIKAATDTDLQCINISRLHYFKSGGRRREGKKPVPDGRTGEFRAQSGIYLTSGRKQQTRLINTQTDAV